MPIPISPMDNIPTVAKGTAMLKMKDEDFDVIQTLEVGDEKEGEARDR